MKRGVNVAIVVTKAIERLIDSTIHTSDIVLLTNVSLRTAQRQFKKYRKKKGKPKGYNPTLREYCEVFPENDPVYTAYRLLKLKKR